MPSCNPWTVVRVPFPYTNRPVEQYRPALVLAELTGIGGPDLLWVAMITSAEHRGWSGDVTIADRAGTGLPSPSVVRCAKLATIERDRAAAIGQLPLQLRQQVAAFVLARFAPLNAAA